MRFYSNLGSSCVEFLRLCMCLGEVCQDGLKNTEKSIYANGVRLFPSGKRLSSFVRSFVHLEGGFNSLEALFTLATITLTWPCN